MCPCNNWPYGLKKSFVAGDYLNCTSCGAIYEATSTISLRQIKEGNETPPTRYQMSRSELIAFLTINDEPAANH
jgi:hypothetical protein